MREGARGQDSGPKSSEFAPISSYLIIGNFLKNNYTSPSKFYKSTG